MSKKVFANGMGISAKKDDNKSICAMPDVCLSPPSPPAGPVPVPYPNTAKASDTSGGSKAVKIGGAQVGLKNSSCYKKSTGDEAATKSLGMGVVTHTIQGKMKHAAWSFDVKIEGKNVIRHMDLTTHNHINCPNSGDMTVNQELQMRAETEEITCEQLEEGMEEMQTDELSQPPTPPGQPPPRRAAANAHYQPAGGPGIYMRSASSQCDIIDDYVDDYQPPRDSREQRPECTEIQIRAGNRIQDAESKILTPISEFTFAPDGAFGNAGGSVLMNITHGSTRAECTSGQDRMPCLHCRRTICAAEDCGIEVWICVDGPEPVRPEEEGLCPPAAPDPEAGVSTEWDPAWAAAGMGCR